MHRREFLLSAASSILIPGDVKGTDMPVGVIEPFQWGSQTIPVSGHDVKGTEAVDAAVTSAMRARGIVGCGISVCKGDAVLYIKGFGFAELPNKPFLPTSAARCGSIAKPITSLCALVLMDQGALDLEAKALPILTTIGIRPTPVDDRVKQITVRHLMDHTSGLPYYTTYTAWRANRNLAQALKLDHVATGRDVAGDALSTARLDTDPGVKFQYANANFVLLARVIEARSKMSFNEYLTKVVMPKFDVRPDEIFVSKNQLSPRDPARGKTEAAYYQTSRERYVSFVPEDAPRGQVFGEAYRGYATESSDGAGGIAVSAGGIAKIIARLHSSRPVLSNQAVQQILTPPEHYTHQTGFDPQSSEYYSKGFFVRYSGGAPWFSHGGMTNHCGGIIGHNAGYQFIAISNWNNVKAPFVDAILNSALTGAVSKIG